MSKYVKGYDNYIITRDGRVINTSTNKELKVCKTARYYNLQLSKGGKARTFSLHRLIAEAYIPNPNNYPAVRHLNDDRTDNRVENLAWGTVSDNMKDKFTNGYKMHSRKLDAEKVGKIRTLKGEFTQEHLAYLFDVSRRTIAQIHNNKIYKDML